MPSKTGQSGVLGKVDPQIIEVLGLDDVSDLNVSDYKTLLKEKMVAQRMGGGGDSANAELITEEWKRVKSIKEEEQPKSKPTGKKVADNFVGRKDSTTKDSTTKATTSKATTTKAPSGTKIAPKKLLPSAGGDIVPADKKDQTVGGDDLSEEVADVRKSVEDLKGILTPGLSKIESNLQGMLDALKKGNQTDKKAKEKGRVSAEKGKKAGREAGLESADVKPQNKVLDTVKKPVMGFFDMILNFIKNIVMGTVVVTLLKLLTNPKEFLDPIFKIINGVIAALNWLIKLVVDSFRNPLNLLIKGLNFGIGFVIDMANKALSIIPGVKDPIAKFEIPEIPEFPAIPKISVQEEAPPVQTAAEGGMVGAQGEPGADGISSFGPPGMDLGLPELSGGTNLPGLGGGGGGTNSLTEQAKVKTFGSAFGDFFNNDDGRSRRMTDLERSQRMSGGGKVSKVDPPKEGIDLKEKVDKLTSIVKEKLMGGQGGGGSAPGLNVGGKSPGLDVGSKAPGLQVASSGGEVPAQKMSVKKGGKINSGSGVKVKGAGKDTQLVAAQPGEIVMSKRAVDKIGADKLLAMNKEGGGDNKPRFINSRNIQRASGGGSVVQTIMAMQGGGSVGSISNSSSSVQTPGPPKKSVNIVNAGGGKKKGSSPSTPPAAGSAADQKVVQPFSSSDVNNSSYIVMKGMYNIVSG